MAQSGEDRWDQQEYWQRLADEGGDPTERLDGVPETVGGEPEPTGSHRRRPRVGARKGFALLGGLTVVVAIGVTMLAPAGPGPAAPAEPPARRPQAAPLFPTIDDPVETGPGPSTTPGTAVEASASATGGLIPNPAATADPSTPRPPAPPQANPPQANPPQANPTSAATTSRAPAPPSPVEPRAGLIARVVNAGTGRAFGVQNASGADGALIVQGAAGTDRWQLTTAGSGCYHLVNVRTGKALDNTEGTSTNGRQMQQWTLFTGTPNQTWCFQGVGGGQYSIKNARSGFLLDVRDGGSGDGVAIQQWNADPARPNANQTWSLSAV